MYPVLDAVSASGLGGGASTLSFNHTLGNVGRHGLIIVGGFGREEGGQTNPEEINNITYNGIAMTRVQSANRNETGVDCFELHGSDVPAAGTYTVVITYNGTGTPDKSRGICASFRMIKDQVKETSNVATSDGGQLNVAITTLTNQALVIAVFGWRVGFQNSWPSGNVTEAVVSRGDNTGGIALAYAVKAVAGEITVSAEAGNTESDGLIVASFAYQAPPTLAGVI